MRNRVRAAPGVVMGDVDIEHVVEVTFAGGDFASRSRIG